ncbi:MAG TPA: carbon starvation CstA family protein, partial [Nannocystis sp.]
GAYLSLDEVTITLAIAAYGFVASVLPVWMLLCPRDYLSSYMKIGTILLLIAGIMIVNPVIEMPMINEVGPGGIGVDGEQFPAVVRGSLFPFVFITIACGAISGFHALIASGTTPKMVDRETDCRPIGYGAMLMEGLVGITALLAATALPPADYFAINTDPEIAVVAGADSHGLARDRAELTRLDEVLTPEDRQRLGLGEQQPASAAAGGKIKVSEALRLSNGTLAALGYHADPADAHANELTTADFARMGIRVEDLPTLAEATDEVVAARTGGAVSLAVGMARVFSGLPGMRALLDYWYHFAIMFEALFILTTIDTGTRVGRFLLQEALGRRWPRLGDTSWPPAAALSSLVIVVGWSYFILTGSIATIWPMFGIANQLLATVALAVGSTILLREARRPAYAWVTLAPLMFVAGTTITAAVRSLFEVYVPMAMVPATATKGAINAGVTGTLLICVLAILTMSARRWQEIIAARRAS